MKKSFLMILAATAIVAFSFTNAIIEKLNADVLETEITWKGYKVTGSHTGTVDLKEGNLEFTDGALSGGSFSIDMATLGSMDLEGEWKGKLDGHLKSEDFFNVEKYPTADFVITKVAPKGTPGDYKIYGDLTIKETTEPIIFYANVKEEGDKKIATASIKVDRSLYNVKYGSGSFFSGLGDKTIYDEFDLDVKLVVK